MLGSSKQIAELQGKVSQLETELATATTGAAALTTELTQAKADLASATQKAAGLEASLAEATGKITKLETDLATATQEAADAKASVQTQVTDRLASAGVAPIARDPQIRNGSATLTRAEFNALGQEARDAFFKNGGKIVG